MRSQSTARIWATPIGSGLLSLFGLVAALIGDGIWDAVSWVALGIPFTLGFWFSVRPHGGGVHTRPPG